MQVIEHASVVDSSMEQQRTDADLPIHDIGLMSLSSVSEHATFTRLEGNDLRMHIFNAMPECMFKRFQLRFCRPEHYVVPHYTINKQGNVSFLNMTKTTFDQLPLRCCIVDPGLIPDDLLETMGICSFEEDKGYPMARIAKKSDKIPILKETFESAARLAPGNSRLYATMDGGLLYFRHKGGVIQYFTNAHDALRSTSHIAGGYQEELAQLVKALNEIGTGKRELNHITKLDAETRSAVEERIRTMLSQYAVLFELCVNAHKVRAQEKLAEAAPLTDKRGRANPSVPMSKMTAAENGLHKRKWEVHKKGRFNAEDSLVLLETISGGEVILQQWEDAIVAAARKFERMPGLGKTPMKPEGMRALTGLRAGNLASVLLDPMRTYAQKNMAKDSALCAAVESGNRETIVETLIEMQVVAKFHRIRNSIERINVLVIDPENRSVGALRQVVTDLCLVLDTEEIFPGVRARRYVQLFEDMKRKAEKFLKMAGEII